MRSAVTNAVISLCRLVSWTSHRFEIRAPMVQAACPNREKLVRRPFCKVSRKDSAFLLNS